METGAGAWESRRDGHPQRLEVSVRTLLPTEGQGMARVDLTSFMVLLKPVQITTSSLQSCAPAGNLLVNHHRPPDKAQTLSLLTVTVVWPLPTTSDPFLDTWQHLCSSHARLAMEPRDSGSLYLLFPMWLALYFLLLDSLKLSQKDQLNHHLL